MVPPVDEVWEELGAERLSSPKRSALAAWRFEPCPILNDELKQGGWIAQSWQLREMESLTLALQRELASSSTENNNHDKNKNTKMLEVSDHSSMASLGTESNALPTPTSSSYCSRHLHAVRSPVKNSLGDTTRSIAHLVAPNGSNGLYGIAGLGNQLSGNAGKASHAPVGNKSHPLGIINGGKVSKPRRSRASSKSPITFLAADPANFKAMVQQVTGVPLNPAATAAPLWSHGGGIGLPLPKRNFSSASAFHNIQGLPTLDTSALRINMSRDRLLAPQQRHVFSSYNSFVRPPMHVVPLINSEVPSRTGELPTENLRSPCVQPWMKIGGSLPFPMSTLDVDGDGGEK